MVRVRRLVLRASGFSYYYYGGGGGICDVSNVVQLMPGGAFQLSEMIQTKQHFQVDISCLGKICTRHTQCCATKRVWVSDCLKLVFF